MPRGTITDTEARERASATSSPRCLQPWVRKEETPPTLPGFTCGQHAMDLADLPSLIPHCSLPVASAVEMHCHRELPGLNLPEALGQGWG